MVEEGKQDYVQPEEPQEAEPESPSERKPVLRRLWARAALAWDWLRRPNEVGRPVALRPRSVQVLVLLILGNLLVLGLLTVALYRTTTTPMVLKATPQQVVATASPGPSASPGPTPTPFGSGGAIAFTLRRNGNADVYALNQADLQLVRLTYDPAEDRAPAWSPDSNYIAFASNRANSWDIYLLDLISGVLIRLTHGPGFDGNPSWSPDGEYIAFESYRNNNLDIYVMSTGGGQERRVTRDRAPDYAPAWSPDGRAIAFTSLRDGNKDVFIRPLDDQKELINITQSPDVGEDSPIWSPDGTWLAYVSGPRGNPSIQVTTFDWDGMVAEQTQTELLGAGTSPAWAPDGQSLIYAYERGGRSHLIAANLTGWALFQEVYSTNEVLQDLAWTSRELSPRIVTRAQSDAPALESPFYVELVQPTPTAGPPYDLTPLITTSRDEETPFLSDRVNESFNALRQRALAEIGWDYLGRLASTWRPMTYTPSSGHSRMSWHVCGRAIALEQEPYESDEPQIELVREGVGNVTNWRVFIRTAEQNGSMGEPLREAVWDLNARQEGGRAMVEGGAARERIPSGYCL